MSTRIHNAETCPECCGRRDDERAAALSAARDEVVRAAQAWVEVPASGARYSLSDNVLRAAVAALAKKLEEA